MNKKFLKLLITFTLLLCVFTVTSFATSDEATPTSISEDETSTQENVSTEETEGTTEEETQTHEGDLYIDENVVDNTADQYISGNVYIKAKEVTISAPIDGNLFVECNKLTINEAYIRNSIFASAKEIYYNGYCNDLYVICNKLETTYDSYIVRHMNAVVNSDLIFKTAVGGNANLTVKGNIDFGADNDIGLVCGNLKVNAKSEITVPDGVVEGEFTNDKNATKDVKALDYMKNGDFFFDKYSNTALYIVIAVVVASIVVAVVIYVVLPKFKNKKKDDGIDSTPVDSKE